MGAGDVAGANRSGVPEVETKEVKVLNVELLKVEGSWNWR